MNRHASALHAQFGGYFALLPRRTTNTKLKIKDYNVGVMAILFKVVIRGIHNNLKQKSNRLEPWLLHIWDETFS